MATPFNASGSKYLRPMLTLVDGKADVYAVLEAFNVTCPARAHAIKKLLCSGLRGKATEAQDLSEARDAIDRAMQMQEARVKASNHYSSESVPLDNVKFTSSELSEETLRQAGIYLTPTASVKQ